MQDIHQIDKTFFQPGIRLNGGSEHALRMNTVHSLGYESGLTVFEALSTQQTPANKIAAVQTLSDFLDEVAPLPAGQKKADLFWETALATQTRFHHFAVEDTAEVSDKMSAFVVNFFKATKNLNDDGVTGKKLAIAESLAEKAHYDYDKHYPGQGHIPNDRATQLLTRLKDADPALFDSPQFQLVAMRMERAEALYGKVAATALKL